MARASAVKMPPEANAAHGCEGARRVLALMLTFSADDHTLTARQLAERTGIATVADRLRREPMGAQQIAEEFQIEFVVLDNEHPFCHVPPSSTVQRRE